MKEKLQQILDNYTYTIASYKKEVEMLKARKEFCKQHNFDEEVRITIIKLHSMEYLYNEFVRMHSEITQLLNDWQS